MNALEFIAEAIQWGWIVFATVKAVRRPDVCPHCKKLHRNINTIIGA